MATKKSTGLAARVAKLEKMLASYIDSGTKAAKDAMGMKTTKPRTRKKAKPAAKKKAATKAKAKPKQAMKKKPAAKRK